MPQRSICLGHWIRLGRGWLALAATSVLVVSGACNAAAEPHAAADKTQDVPRDEDAPLRAGEDWPQFLGPGGTGVAVETGLLEPWPEDGPPVAWTKRIGTGYSAPSVRGRRLVLHHRLRNHEIVECLDARTGDELWRYEYESHFSDPFGYNNGPRCTPLLTEDRCYTFGAEGMLVCLTLETGEKIWSRDTQQEFDLPQWFFGVGCTPILEGNLLVVLVGGQPDSGVVAFDAESGKTVWESVGKETWDGAPTGSPEEPKYAWTGEEQIASYSSPIAATIHGQRHLLCLLRQGLVSLDPAGGRLNFKYWFRSSDYESVNAARPVVIGDKIFLSAAYRVGSALLQVNEDGKGYRELWRNPRNMLNHWSTSIHVDGYIYGFSGRHENEGTLRCLELETGKVMWQTSGYEGDVNHLRQNPATGQVIDAETKKEVPWPFFGRGSKIRVGDRFIVLGERGTLALLKINPREFEELARTSYPQIRYPAWAAPVLSRKRLYLRSETSLLCLDLAPNAEGQ